MKKIKIVFLSLALSLISLLGFAGAEKGNGQLVVKDSKGRVLPFEEFVSEKSRSYMGYHYLPRTNDYSTPFERDYITEFDRWIEFVSNYSKFFAMNLQNTIEKTDFVFLDSDIAFKIQDYPMEQGLNVDFFKAAGFYKSHIYLSIPQMDKYTDSDRYTAEQLRSFTIIHELLHAYGYGYRNSISDKLSMGSLILDARKSQMSKLEFHIHAAKFGYHLWTFEDLNFRIEFVRALKRLQREDYLSGTNPEKSDLNNLVTLSKIIEWSKSNVPLRKLFPTHSDLRSAALDIVSTFEVANEQEKKVAYQLFSRATNEDFLFWLKTKALVSAPRAKDGQLKYEPRVDDYLYEKEGRNYFEVQGGYGFLVPVVSHSRGAEEFSRLERDYSTLLSFLVGRRNGDYEEMALSIFITPYLIQYAQEFLGNWEPSEMCSKKSLEDLNGVNPLFLLYGKNSEGNWRFQGRRNGNASVLNFDSNDIRKWQDNNPKLKAITAKVKSIKDCISHLKK